MFIIDIMMAIQLAVGMAASDPDIRSRCVPVRPL